MAAELTGELRAGRVASFSEVGVGKSSDSDREEGRVVHSEELERRQKEPTLTNSRAGKRD